MKKKNKILTGTPMQGTFTAPGAYVQVLIQGQSGGGGGSGSPQVGQAGVPGPQGVGGQTGMAPPNTGRTSMSFGYGAGKSLWMAAMNPQVESPSGMKKDLLEACLEEHQKEMVQKGVKALAQVLDYKEDEPLATTKVFADYLKDMLGFKK